MITKCNREKCIQIALIILTIVMIVLRFLMNEKGRVNPDSIRFMRSSFIFPVIDNTTAPLLYPLSLKFFTFFGTDEFWSSKIVGILSYLIILFFTWKKKFYFKETLLTGALFSFVSIFSYTMSESLFLVFLILYLYVAHEIFNAKLKFSQSVLLLTATLLLMYNTRYNGLFYIASTGIFGLLFWKKNWGKIFITSAFLGIVYYVLYKILFIDYFNPEYVKNALEIGFIPTSQLLDELWKGLATSFNPFIHISNPNGGIINWGIYGIGLLNITIMFYLFKAKKLEFIDFFFIFSGIFGIAATFFIQYFYVITPLDYRLLAPFTFPIWLVYFKKIIAEFTTKTYVLAFMSICVGFVFSYLSKGNYLENRKIAKDFLKTENLENKPIYFYILSDDKDMDYSKKAELLSTVNPNVTIVRNPEDTLRKNTFTKYKIRGKMNIIKNKYQ